MIKRTTVIAAFVLSGVFASGGYIAQAQQNQEPVEQNQNRISATDRQFMVKAAQAGIAEITLAQLALQRAVTNEARQYAQKMIEDHTQANSELMQLAAEKGVTLPTTMDSKHMALRARLGQIPGKRFDQTYINEMVRDHQNVTAMFQRQTRVGQDPDVKSFAANKLPALRDHWQMARAMRGNIARANVR